MSAPRLAEIQLRLLRALACAPAYGRGDATLCLECGYPPLSDVVLNALDELELAGLVEPLDEPRRHRLTGAGRARALEGVPQFTLEPVGDWSQSGDPIEDIDRFAARLRGER